MQRPTSASADVSPFLRIPVELRRLVYQYVLPHTTTFDVRLQRPPDPAPKTEFNLTFVRQKNGDGGWRMQKTSPRVDRETGNDIVWRRGCTNLLAVNRQVHEEAADMLYGENIFVIDVTFDTINFRYRWRTANNLTPNRTYQFLDHFSQRNLLRIKNYIINIESVDDYTGMIKYNCGGRGLPAGIRGKVQELVDLLAVVPQLHRLQIHLIDGAISRVRFPSGRVHRVQDESNYAQTQTVLDPFRALYEVRKAQVSGVSDAYAERLEKSMVAQRVARGSCSVP
ncbi:Nn.00g068890.m01.CDS01 [Neocucurbitaria sp. VM-36]